MTHVDAGSLPTLVEGAIAEAGIEPSCVQLELTESNAMADPAAALEVMNELRSIGVSLSIDDFGIGYSSLAYLSRLPVETVKIDRSFVAGLPGERGDEAVVGAVVDMARRHRTAGRGRRHRDDRTARGATAPGLRPRSRLPVRPPRASVGSGAGPAAGNRALIHRL